MPAVTVETTLVLPRVPRPDPAQTADRPVKCVVQSHRQVEGAGVEVRRPFPGAVSLADADPFLLLDQLGPLMNGPAEAAGGPWHPHRGFETVSYERMYRLGGPGHAVQLWVNLPSSLKLTAPRYQAITRDDLLQLTNDDGGALLRLIAGTIADYQGPGVTHTPITYVHATIAPGAQLSVPLDVLLLGGLPIREPIAHYGPFVMNSRDEITQAITDYRAGRTGIIPADQTAPRRCS